jgi:hypothetical protein
MNVELLAVWADASKIYFLFALVWLAVDYNRTFPNRRCLVLGRRRG